MTKVLMIDNADSFTHNLNQYLREAGCEVVTYRNTVDVGIVRRERPNMIVISPGPSSPANAGISMEVVRRYEGNYPIFGVCLGMQVMLEAYGTRVERLEEVVHGGASEIYHDGRTIFEGLPQQFAAGRYHSLGVQALSDESALEASAYARTSKDGQGNGSVLMAVRHREYPIEGVQFHPESVLTMRENVGMRLMENVVKHLAGQQ